MEPRYLGSDAGKKAVQRALVTGGGVLLTLLLTLFAAGSQADSSPIVSGPSAPWREQLAAAQTKATSIDPSAVLALVEAQPVSAGADSALSVRFGFLTQSRGYIWVALDDTRPAQSMSVEGAGKTGDFSTSAQTLQRLRKAAEQVNLSPRDAIRQTLAKTGVSTQGYSLSYATLHMDDSVSGETKTAAAWSVHFVTADSSYGTEFTVDARTGKIVRQGDKDSMCGIQ